MRIKYNRNYSSSRNNLIISECKNKNVLHIWCTDDPYTEEKYNNIGWPLLFREIDKVCKEQLGIDISEKWIEFLNGKSSNFPNSRIINFDMNFLWDLDFSPDVIVLWEVIEHLMNIEVMLTTIKKIMNKDTILIISTPNAFFSDNFLRAILWFEYLHDDHKVLFSMWYLINLLKFNWLEVTDSYFTRLDCFYNNKNSSKLFYILDFLNNILLHRIFPSLSGTLFVKCKLLSKL